MKLSDAIEEFVTMKLEGEPKGSDWQSIQSTARQREEYQRRLEELRREIDAAIGPAHKERL